MTTVTRQVRTAAAAAVAALALTTLSACGDETPSAGSGTPSAPRTASNGDVFNDADVRFATDMVPHHAEAIEMVTLTDGRPLDPEVQALAEQVRATQAPEVETMVDWLTAWDAAGKVHAEIQAGFVRAEVIGWRELVDAGGYGEARERGLIRTEGREYAVRDGDVITIRH